MDMLRLQGLRRISPCCLSRVAHGWPWAHEFGNLLICVDCREVVFEHLVENCLGEVVWPPSEEDVAETEMPARVKKCRRKPTEADPVGYRLILPWRRG